MVGNKFTVFALFHFVFEGNFPSTSPPGGLYLERRFNGGFFVLPLWGAHIWRGSYMEGLIFGILQFASHGNLVGSFHRVSKFKNYKIFSRHVFEKNSVICIASVRFVRPFHTSSHTNPLCTATTQLPAYSLWNKTLLVSGATLPHFWHALPYLKKFQLLWRMAFSLLVCGSNLSYWALRLFYLNFLSLHSSRF